MVVGSGIVKFITAFICAPRLPTTNYQLPTNHYICSMKILMVCLGNICRSPLAEGILQHMAAKAGLDWTIDSAGTNGYHTGEPPHRLSIKVAAQNGIDISTQRSRIFVAADFDNYDMIYAMAGDVMDEMKSIAGKKFDHQKAKLFLNELSAGENRDVPDPWYGTEPGYHDAFEIIREACETIIKKYANQQVSKYA